MRKEPKYGDLIFCEILIKEGKYREAIGELQNKVNLYLDSSTKVEFLTRIANVYGDFLKDKANAKDFADRAAALDPGSELLDSAYLSAGIVYDSARFRSSPSNNVVIANKNGTEKQTTTQIDAVQDFISVNPNPANPVTTITYSIKSSSTVKLTIYAVNGQKIATLVDGTVSAGTHSVKFDGSKLASGLYFYKFESAGLNRTGKMLLLK
jgi:hypothetical protein